MKISSSAMVEWRTMAAGGTLANEAPLTLLPGGSSSSCSGCSSSSS
jgi:hypothetical protein